MLCYKIFSMILGTWMIHFGATSSPMKVIIDTDAGGDDALAILLALNAKQIKVIAITCTYGNTYEPQIETNVLKILTVAKRHDIPVFGGAVKPMLRNSKTDYFYGEDGLGDFSFEGKISVAVDRSKQAYDAMTELSKKYSGDLNIITLGPLTNVALAAQTDANFTQRIRRFYTMGSQLNEPGKEKQAEFNFAMDPESDAIFLKSPMKNKILITPFDTITRNAISKVWREEVLGKLNSTAIKFLNEVERISLTKEDGWKSSDAIAMATLIWPNLVTFSIQTYMSVVTCGSLSGVTNTDKVPPQGEAENVEVITDFDVEGFKSLLLKNLRR